MPLEPGSRDLVMHIMNRERIMGGNESSAIGNVRVDDSFLLTWLSHHPLFLGVVTERSTFSSRLKNQLSNRLLAQSAAQSPIAEIVELIGQTGCIDHLLYLTQKRHRDHTLHQVKVAVLGLFLLQCGVRQDETLLGFIRDVLARKYSGFDVDATELHNEDVIRCWMIASLLHDVGYPLSHLNASCQFIIDNERNSYVEFVDLATLILRQYRNRVYFGWDDHFAALRSSCRTVTSVITQCTGTISSCLDAYVAQLSRITSTDISHQYKHWPFLALVGHMKTCERADRITLAFDHGLWTAANLANRLKSHYESAMSNGITLVDLILLEAIDAVSVHNAFARINASRSFRRSYRGYGLDKVNICISPIAALLQICDEIHEWGRITVMEKAKVKEEIERVNLGPFEYVSEGYRFTDELMITFELAESRELGRTGWLSDKFCEAKRQLAIIELSGLPNPRKLSLGFMHPIT